MKRVFILHGWGASPSDNWFPWLKMNLSSAGLQVTVPRMPDTSDPQPEAWVGLLSSLVGRPDEDTCLVGHSLGAMAILKYLESEASGRIGLAVLVAPWPNLNSKKDSKYSKVAHRWMDAEPDWRRVKANAKRIAAIFSTTDPYVLVSNSEVYGAELDAKIIIEENKGHIVQETAPTVLNSIFLFSK